MTDVTEPLLALTAQDIAATRRLPEATYRLQLHAGFTFRDVCALVPYLHELGVTDAYTSPYLKARPGSTHGYDITDHRQLNPEIGSEEDFEAFVAALRARGMSHVLDMVPNHMGVVGNENAWWSDVLENGEASAYAGYFDISWEASHRPGLRGRVLLPVLGDPYGKVLESGQLRLEYEAGGFAVRYFEHRFLVAPRTYELILGHGLEGLRHSLPVDAPDRVEYESILTAVRHLPPRTETGPEKIAERQREKEVVKRRLAALERDSEAVRATIGQTVAAFNGTPGEPASFALLDRLLDEQAYRLSYWRVASDEINYRRFFDVNELAALSMERPEVFAATHALVLRLLAEGKIGGLRIDHPDGLFDPRQYLFRLQEHFVLARARRLFESRPEFRGREWPEVEGPLAERVRQGLAAMVREPGMSGSNGVAAPATHYVVASVPPAPLAALGSHWPLYVVVEKILGASEPLPADWLTDGTSGYDFLNAANGLFVDGANAVAFTRLYREWVADDTPFAEVVYRKKFLILQAAMSSELHMLTHQLDRLAQKDRWSRDFTLNGLRHALREVIACFPVYRSYISPDGVREADRKCIVRAVQRARARNPAISSAVFDFVRDMLLGQRRAEGADPAERLRFAGKFQQVTSPVMAKGLEDTAFYVYNRLASLNEVGGDPGRFGMAPAALHRTFAERRAKWPYALSPLSTHDTKRSEDVRARLNVLSELPGEWRDRLAHWSRLNEPHRVPVEDAPAPDANEEYLFYQTLLGAWPLEPYSEEDYADFVRRVQAYMEKALHEAKVHTSWINPDAAYDDAVRQFVGRVLDPQAGAAFLRDFRSFQRRVSHYGLFNSLSQTLVRLTAPGVPDTYQGTELWDFSLVDPDNRRPVDYGRRRTMLTELRSRVAAAGPDLRGLAQELLEHRADGRVKLFVTYRVLHGRREAPGLFSSGDYLPVEADGARAEHVFAFARRHEGRCALVAVPRLVTRLVPTADGLPLGADVWGDTRLVLPPEVAGRRWTNVFTGRTIAGRGAPAAAEIFADFPVALLVSAE
jgi:(1->4)-alpha-D-glucan 1-alpha-D-glucosylmutase